jgi:hypothetical protein
MKKTILFSLLAFLISCHNSSFNKKIETFILREDSLNSILRKKFDTNKLIKPIKFSDSIQYTFCDIDSIDYQFLMQKTQYVDQPHDDFTKIAGETDSCIYIKFPNGKTDSLDNFLNNMNVKYSLKCYSKKNNYLIISYFDSEADFLKLVDLSGSKYYGLYNELKLSPNQKIIVSYNNHLINPLSSNGLSILRLDKISKKIDWDLTDTKWEIIDFNWINNDNAILKLETFNQDSFKVTERMFLIMKCLN